MEKKKKKYNPEKVKLDAYEQSIENAIDYKKMKKPTTEEQAQVKAMATETLRELKSARANIRMNEGDMEAVRELAEKAGMPYQTLINHVIHLYVTGQLVSVQEVKKMADAGVFDRLKTG
ncbi:hypothetical protein WDW37_07995 [Bdellovibrionota bacterium FG-1]